MWEELPIEKKLEQALVKEFGDTEGKTHYGDYTVARTKLLNNVWENVQRKEPHLTDHGPRHIEDVLKQVDQLLPCQYLKPREMLLLMLSILFHDTGNIYGRDNHERKISEIYDFVRGTPLPPEKFQEKKLLLAIVGAHGGVARDGKSKDTIQDLLPVEPFLQKMIRLREITAILRFADELAEGPQRTSDFLRRIHDFDIKSEKFHDYASITSVTIDQGSQRIALTYHISVSSKDWRLEAEELNRLRNLLRFAYYRILKLDDERQYARYYSTGLEEFKRTSASFDLWLDHSRIDIGLQPLELTDLKVPGDTPREISGIDVTYDIEAVVGELERLAAAGKTTELDAK